jgi:hypothetical protein
MLAGQAVTGCPPRVRARAGAPSNLRMTPSRRPTHLWSPPTPLNMRLLIWFPSQSETACTSTAMAWCLSVGYRRRICSICRGMAPCGSEVGIQIAVLLESGRSRPGPSDPERAEPYPPQFPSTMRPCTAGERFTRPQTSSERRVGMPEPHTPQTPRRRVGVYERLGRVGGSPAKTIGIAIVVLIILIAIIMALAW